MKRENSTDTEELIESAKNRVFVVIDSILITVPIVVSLVKGKEELFTPMFWRRLIMFVFYGSLGTVHRYAWKKLCRFALAAFSVLYTVNLFLMDLDLVVAPLSLLLSALISQMLFMFDKTWQKWLFYGHIFVFVFSGIIAAFLLPAEGCRLTEEYAKKKLVVCIFMMIVTLSVWFYFTWISNEIFEDVKRFSLLRDQEAKEKENFFASMSHEIRNPIQSLMGSIELIIPLIKEGPDSQQLATIARNCCEVVLNLVSNILDISKLQAGKVVLATSFSDPRESVMRVVRLQKMKADSKGLILSFIDDPLLPTVLDIDSFRLSQVVLNLVSNSIKFTNRGGIYIKLKWESERSVGRRAEPENSPIPDERPSFEEKEEEISLEQAARPLLASKRKRVLDKEGTLGKMTIEIKDTGIGISAENLEKLFRPYSQADATISKRFGGTGLGLWISKSIIQLMGGNIKVNSRLGEGSEFIIQIPAVVGKELPLIAEPNASSSFLQMLDNKQCLILDDIIENCTILEYFLKRNGVRPISFIDGPSALSYLESNPNLDAIITDLRMPIMSGQTFITEVRRMEKVQNRKSLPIIVVTAESNNDIKVECLSQVGANGFLLKPIQLSDLLHLLYDLINKSKNENKSILILEDEKMAGVFLKKTIEGLGHKVTLCQTVAKAIECVDTHYYELLYFWSDSKYLYMKKYNK